MLKIKSQLNRENDVKRKNRYLKSASFAEVWLWTQSAHISCLIPSSHTSGALPEPASDLL